MKNEESKKLFMDVVLDTTLSGQVPVCTTQLMARLIDSQDESLARQIILISDYLRNASDNQLQERVADNVAAMISRGLYLLDEVDKLMGGHPWRIGKEKKPTSKGFVFKAKLQNSYLSDKLTKDDHEE